VPPPPPIAGAASPDVQKENRYSAVRSSPGQAVRRGPQGGQLRNTMNKPPPQKHYVTTRLPLPKNAVLLSLIQASEPARRRAEEANLPPEMPPSPEKQTVTGNQSFSGTSNTRSNSENAGSTSLPKFTKPSPLFLDPSSSASHDAEHPSEYDEEQKIRVGTYLEGGPCGTYAVAVKTGLLVYPTLFEHTLQNDNDDVVKRDVEELVKNNYRNKMLMKKNENQKSGTELGASSKGSSDVGASARTSLSGRKTPQSMMEHSHHTLVECHEKVPDGHHEGDHSIAVEAQFSPKESVLERSFDNDGDDDDSNNDSTTANVDISSALSDPGGSKPMAIIGYSALVQNINAEVSAFESTPMRSFPRSSSTAADFMSKSEHVPPTTPPPGAKVKPSTDPALTTTLKLQRQFSHGSYNPINSSGGDEFDRPLIRLKYGDRVQVVSMDSRGWVKLARGYGYIRLENDKQLVKVGGTSDKACQIEAMLHELSIERNRLKYEQKKLERLSAGLMIDLQSTLLTSDDLVVVPAPAGIPRSDSELSLLLPRKMDRQASNVSVDDLDISKSSRSSLTSPRVMSNLSGDRITGPQPREIRSVKSHSPGRQSMINSKTPPSPPAYPTTPGGSSYTMTPTRVNFRTGLSGHRALSSSHSHPHDFIGRPSRSMSNHAGLSSKKKSSSTRGRSIY